MIKVLNRIKILITSGPTWIPVDPMRILTNRSSGQMGQLLANQLAQAGAEITVCQGEVRCSAAGRHANIKVKPFQLFDELEKLLGSEVKKKYRIVIHAAAVSDYRVKKLARKKIRSGVAQLSLELTPTRKLINMIKKKNPDICLIGFKWESRLSPAIVKRASHKLFQDAACDLVIVNTTSQDKYEGYLVGAQGDCLGPLKSRTAVSEKITQWIIKKYRTDQRNKK